MIDVSPKKHTYCCCYVGDLWLVRVTDSDVNWEMLTVAGGPGPRYSMVYGVMGNYLIISQGTNAKW